MFADDREALEVFSVPKEPCYSLVGSLDSIILLRRDMLLCPAAAAAGSDFFVATSGARLTDLPSHAILDRGSVVGLWDFDPEAVELVWVAFVKNNRALEAAVSETETFVRDQLGDARTFSLDSPKSRVSRLEKLRDSVSQRA